MTSHLTLRSLLGCLFAVLFTLLLGGCALGSCGEEAFVAEDAQASPTPTPVRQQDSAPDTEDAAPDADEDGATDASDDDAGDAALTD